MIPAFLFILLMLSGMIALYLYVAQGEDRRILAQCPNPPRLINTEVELANNRLQRFAAKWKNLPPQEQATQKLQLQRLQKKVDDALARTQADFSAYEQAARNLLQAWWDYDEAFFQTHFFRRSLSPRIHEEIRCFRAQFKAMERRYKIIEKRLASRERIWLNEGHNKQKKEQNAPEAEPSLKNHPVISIGGVADLARQLPQAAGFTFIGTTLDFSELPLTRVAGGSLAASRFVGVQITGAVEFATCDFTAADFSHAQFSPTQGIQNFSQCRFITTSWNHAQLNEVGFYHCLFQSCDFTGLTLKKVKFVDCAFSQCQLDALDFSSCSLSQSMLKQIPVPSLESNDEGA